MYMLHLFLIQLWEHSAHQQSVLLYQLLVSSQAASPNNNSSNKSMMTSSGSSTNLGAYTAFSDILSPPSPTGGTGGFDDDGEGVGSPNVTKMDRRMQLLHELTAAGDHQQQSQPQPQQQQQKPSQQQKQQQKKQQQQKQSQPQSHTRKVGSPGFEVEDQLDELLLNGECVGICGCVCFEEYVWRVLV